MIINFNRVESAQSFGHPDQFFGFVVNVAILDCLWNASPELIHKHFILKELHEAGGITVGRIHWHLIQFGILESTPALQLTKLKQSVILQIVYDADVVDEPAAFTLDLPEVLNSVDVPLAGHCQCRKLLLVGLVRVNRSVDI